jgi:glycine hydroxymethyltransferase
MNQLFELTAAETLRQKNSLHLIASDNYPSPKTLALMGSVWSNKYAEGYPGKRYYAGQIYSDQLESKVQELALRVFDTTIENGVGEYGVNVQVLSGSPANAMVFLSVLEAGDTILSLSLANGGHLSHLHATSAYLKFFKLVNYDLKETEDPITSDNVFEIDEQDFINKLVEFKPKLVILGFSAYPRKFEFAQFCRLAHQHGALVLADIAHINGLVAAGLHDSPFKKGEDGADFVSMTTHKTLRAGRGAMVFAKTEYITKLNKTIFPGTSGGPHLNQIAAVGQGLIEILGEDEYPDGVSFKEYSINVIENCKQLELGLIAGGLESANPTQNHLCLIKLPDNLDSLEIQKKLENVNIICNRNLIPFDTKTAWRPSGLRFGTAALSSRGISAEQSYKLGENIAKFVLGKMSEEEISAYRQNLVDGLNWWY